MTLKAKEELEQADVIVGYATYVDLIRSLLRPNVEVIAGGMGEEVERAKVAIERAMKGKHVAVVSSGDAGVYGMAGPVLELASLMRVDVPIEVVPGV
ncbi:MAG: SAM-dependent methyltransferase, partial [Candidatus Bathyarchaeia archaeon]